MGNLAHEPIRVLLVDDHAILRSGVRLLLESGGGMRVVGEAADRQQAVALARREQPDSILLDLDLPGTHGLELLPELLAAAPSARVIILTGVNDPEAHASAMRLGARGLVRKEKAPEVLLKAVEKVHHGELWLDRSLLTSLLDERAGAGNHRRPNVEAVKIASLTEREREVVSLIGEGLKNKQIAERLFISEGTVRNHLTTIFGKLDVSDRFELMMYAYRHDLAKPPI